MAKTIDIIIKFQGTLGSEKEIIDDDVFPAHLLATYNKGAKTTNREVVRIGHLTTTIPPASDGIMSRTLTRMREAWKGNNRGNVFIYGSSSGGRNAIEFAERLTASGISELEYVAVMDPAWSLEETKTVPNAVDPKFPTNTPQFAPKRTINASGAKDNFFQTAGNRGKKRWGGFRDPLFTSFMAGEEIHGDIDGFTKEDWTSKIAAGRSGTTQQIADQLHIDLIKNATPEVQKRIAGRLDKLQEAALVKKFIDDAFERH